MSLPEVASGGNPEPPPSVTDRCRICLIDHGCMTSLQTDSVEDKLKDLTKCTRIDIKHDENLPGVVCHVCLYKLNMWSEFKERFIQSNKALLEQLEMSETSDNIVKDSSKSESYTTKDAKRKRKSGEISISDIEKKKSRMDISSSEVTCDTGQIILDTICISDDDDDKSDSHKNTKQNAKNSEEHMEGKIYSGPMRARLLSAKRGKNIQRRKASMKRWVERKLALFAATGENMSDTDSIASDDVQMSPVQKARAKTNAEKEMERQKKVAKVLKNLETNLTEKYTAFRDKDTDSDTRRTRLSKESQSNALQQRNKNSLLNKINKKNAEKNAFSLDSMENSPISLTDNVMSEVCEKSKMQTDDQTFTPHSVKSELVVGDITYAVTSTLILVDPLNVDKVDINNLTKDSKNSSPDESNREKNTDIIDAVQLRRVNPAPTNANSKSNSKFVERCLNIEVEGNELAVLKRVQYELADFVKKEMKQKLFGTSNGVAKIDTIKTDSVTCIRQKLDQKLKDIIELAIKKNIESSMVREIDDICHGVTFSPTLVKIAMKSPKYQPKVMIKRLDIAKESKHYNINNAHALKSNTSRGKLSGPFSVITRKRQSVPPIRYCDYNVTALDNDFDTSNDDDDDNDNDDTAIRETPKSINSRISNLATRRSIIGKTEKQNEQKADYEEVIKIEGAIAENHICGVCGLTFHSRKEVEEHVRNHKATGISTMQVVLQNESATSPQKGKRRRKGKQKMRCARCHEVVHKRFVKVHVCKTSVHKCYVCDSMFRTKNLLADHLESHDHSEFNIINAIGNKKFSNADALIKILSTSTTSQKDQVQEPKAVTKTQTVISEKNDIQSDKISSTGVKLDSTENIVKKPKETYTCFVCDKIFTDEEVLKDHLQKHCDDLSEGEQSNSKEQYQCAICGNTLESDQALEDHVGKHLFDDEDDNPNLISIDQNKEDNNQDKPRETETYQCGQCSETFDSEMLLEMHMQAHEEEIAIATWEKEGMKVYQYQCMLCDGLYDTEKELAEHLDIHNANAQVCQLCDKSFRTLEDLQEHVATH